MKLNFSEIETNRIILRFLIKEDINDMLSYRNNSDIAKYQGFEPKYTKESMEEFINTYSTDNVDPKKSWIQIGIEYKQDKKIIGDIGIHIENIGGDFYQAQLGISLNTNYQRKGIANETIKTLMKFLFNNWNCYRIYVEIDTRNNKSIDLFKKLNFRKEAHLINNYFFKSEWASVYIYAMLRNEYFKNNK